MKHGSRAAYALTKPDANASWFALERSQDEFWGIEYVEILG